MRNDRSTSSNGDQIVAATNGVGNNQDNEKNTTMVRSFSTFADLSKFWHRKQPENKMVKKEEKIKTKKDKSAAKKERKATKTLAIVLGNITQNV